MTDHPLHPARAVRVAFISGARLQGWSQRFSEAHGALGISDDDDGVRLTAADGAEALLQAPWPADGRPGRGADHVERLAVLASQPRTLALLLVRRGGYAVAVVRSGEILAAKSGTRSAARGSAQKKSARRREEQADGLVGAVAAHAAIVFATQQVEYVVPGGDRTLAELTLARPELSRYAAVPRLAALDVPDPRPAVLRKAALDACAVRIQVTDPPS